ncbi:MAG TPA: hypothetical protein VM779_05580 [Thermoanaerobaculia bacterium]|nr:hypothetical protein [Thermoanaerobaculia bacterium]
MEWADCDFIVPRVEERRDTSDLTGWETVVFEIEDDDGGMPGAPAQNMGFSAS